MSLVMAEQSKFSKVPDRPFSRLSLRDSLSRRRSIQEVVYTSSLAKARTKLSITVVKNAEMIPMKASWTERPASSRQPTISSSKFSGNYR